MLPPEPRRQPTNRTAAARSTKTVCSAVSHQPVGWWLRAVEIEETPVKRGLKFDTYLVLIQAALDGQGIALGGGRLAGDFLARGALIRPIQTTMLSDKAFYLLVPSEVPLSPQATRFRDWILAEAEAAPV